MIKKKKTVRIENKQLFGYQSIFCTNVCVRMRENGGVGERERERTCGDEFKK